MFHCGFEWPVDERTSFQKRIVASGWPLQWFAQAEIGGEPWVYYMTQEFIDHCLKTMNRVMSASLVNSSAIRFAAPQDTILQDP